MSGGVPHPHQAQQHMQLASTSLNCEEPFPRASSPISFPENVPGAWDANRENVGDKQGKTFRTELDQDDVRLVNELGRLTADQLADYIKNLQNTTYILGIEEAKQFSKGKLLQIFQRKSDFF